MTVVDRAHTERQRAKLITARDRLRAAAADASGRELQRLNLEAAGLEALIEDLDRDLAEAVRGATQMEVKAIPDGYHSVTPCITANGAAKLIGFMTQALGARERMRMPTPDGKIAHAELEIGDSVVMVADATPEFPPAVARNHLYVENCDEVYKRALAAGAKSLAEPTDQFYGDRTAYVIDPLGNHWNISTRVDDLSDADLEKRISQMARA